MLSAESPKAPVKSAQGTLEHVQQVTSKEPSQKQAAL